jgi:hypothetical protein
MTFHVPAKNSKIAANTTQPVPATSVWSYVELVSYPRPIVALLMKHPPGFG